MTVIGETIFWENARGVLRDINMPYLDPAHGAAVTIVKRCLNVRGRPTYHQQTFLESESLPLLAYLEKLATSGDSSAWRRLEARIRLHAELLRETELQPCASPWLAAIWHVLPELVAIGQTILDDQKEPENVADFEVAPEATVERSSVDSGDSGGNDGDDKGSAGKSGSAGTVAKPRPPSRLVLPVVPVVLTDAERKALGLGNAPEPGLTTDAAPEGPEGADGPGGMKGGPK